MDKLHADWLTQDLIDFEYKKYVLLAYLKSVKNAFEHQRLYPFLSDLVFHYQNLLQVKENKKLLYENFPQRISRADFSRLEISYRKIIDDDETMQELEAIATYALPLFRQALSDGKEIYEYIEKSLEIAPVGLTPVYFDEGYLFLHEHLLKDVRIYLYQITIFENAQERFRGINLQMIETVRKGVGETYEGIKTSLIRRFRELPNPATFLVSARIPCPLEESLLPVAKRVLVKYVSSLAA